MLVIMRMVIWRVAHLACWSYRIYVFWRVGNFAIMRHDAAMLVDGQCLSKGWLVRSQNTYRFACIPEILRDAGPALAWPAPPRASSARRPPPW